MERLEFDRRRWLTAYAPLLIWTIVILGLGSSIGAMNETSRFIRPLLEFLFPSADPNTLALYHGLIRKAAHVAEYAVLGILALRAFRKTRHRGILAIVLVALIAFIDELNQSFNPSRTSIPWDVLLDVFGGLLGIGANVLLIRARDRKASD